MRKTDQTALAKEVIENLNYENSEMKKKLDKTFTIDEIEDVWFSIYNEELKEDNPRFLSELLYKLNGDK